MSKWNWHLQCCGNCAFWGRSKMVRMDDSMPYGEGGPHTDGTVARCLRRAPIAADQRHYPGATAKWPETNREDRCGDFQHCGMAMIQVTDTP